MSETLKSCPFCDGEAVFEENADNVKIVCTSCGASTLWTAKPVQKYIVDEWNNRSHKRTTQIKSCPFCGSNGNLWQAMGSMYIVQCMNCAISSDYYETEEEAKSAWNRRLIMSKEQKQIPLFLSLRTVSSLTYEMIFYYQLQRSFYYERTNQAVSFLWL